MEYQWGLEIWSAIQMVWCTNMFSTELYFMHYTCAMIYHPLGNIQSWKPNNHSQQQFGKSSNWRLESRRRFLYTFSWKCFWFAHIVLGAKEYWYPATIKVLVTIAAWQFIYCFSRLTACVVLLYNTRGETTGKYHIKFWSVKPHLLKITRRELIIYECDIGCGSVHIIMGLSKQRLLLRKSHMSTIETFRHRSFGWSWKKENQVLHA